MKFAARLAFVALGLFSFAPAIFAAHSHVPTPSTWTLDVKASDFGGGPTMKSDVYVMLTDTEKWMKYTEVTVDGDGKKVSFSWSGAPDGKMHTVMGMKGATAGFNAADDSGHMVMPDGTTEDLTMSYSDDKKKTTIKVVMKDKAGHTFHQTLVYNRTK